MFEFENDRFYMRSEVVAKDVLRFRATYYIPCGEHLDLSHLVDTGDWRDRHRPSMIHLRHITLKKEVMTMFFDESKRLSGHRFMAWTAHYAKKQHYSELEKSNAAV